MIHKSGRYLYTMEDVKDEEKKKSEVISATSSQVVKPSKIECFMMSEIGSIKKSLPRR